MISLPWFWVILTFLFVALSVVAILLLRLRRITGQADTLAEKLHMAELGNWTLDLVDGRIVCSEEMYRIFGIDPGQHDADIGLLIERVHPDDRNDAWNAYSGTLECGSPFDIEHRLLVSDGRVRYVKATCVIHRGTDGRPLRKVGTLQDITIWKVEELRLRQALESAEGVIDAVPDLLFEVNRDGRYLNVWAQNPEQLAAQKEALLGRTVHEIFTPENAAVAMAAIREADENGYAHGKTICLDLPIGKRWFEHSLSKKSASDPSAVTFMVLSRDVTDRLRIEKELAERERELTALAESSPGMIGCLHLWPDGTLHVPFVTQNVFELFGLHAEDVIQDAGPLLAAIHPEDVDKVRESIGRSACEMSLWHQECRILHPRKGERWMEGSANPRTHPDGGVIWYGSMHDITERKRIEVALSESEVRYRYHFNLLQSMMESSSEVSVFALDRDYRYLFFNNRHREGAKRIRGTDIAIGMDMVASIPDPEFGDFCRQGFDRVLAGNSVSVGSREVVVQDDVTTYEYNDNHGSPIYDDAGEVVGLTVFSINTTERKRLEAELLESRNFLDLVIDAVPDPIFVKDRQHRWILLNDAFCQFIGRSREALIGKSDYDFFPREEADVFWEKDELVFNSGEINLNEERFTSADGKQHFIQTKKTPSTALDGSQMLVGVIRDITDRKSLEEAREVALAQARHLASARSEFLAQMSHELRTPLNGILGYTQLLNHDRSLDAKQQSKIAVIQESGEHLLTLINDILDFARCEEGRIELQLSDTAFDRFLHTIVGMVEVKAKEKGIEFKMELSTGLPDWVSVDEKRLRQVLLNLLSNAVKFTEKGRVGLRIDPVQTGRLRFVVLDSGIGIAAEHLEAIFQPFVQVADKHCNLGGTGLGLPISRTLVRLMGGEIEVDSTPGVGSEFRFEINAGLSNAREQASKQDWSVVGYTGARKTVLVVDDIAENRRVARDMLETFGFRVGEAADGQAAIEQVLHHQPDAILMDVSMPVMGGVEAACHLRQLSDFAHIPIIFMSAGVSGANRDACIAAGGDAFLNKPLDMRAALEQIGALLHLEWIHEEVLDDVGSDNTIILPDAVDLEALYHQAELGDMKAIIERLDHIETRDKRYRHFCGTLRDLAVAYQSRAALSYIRQCLDCGRS